VVGVLADDGLQLPGLEELGLLVAQVQDHVGAALGAGDRLQLVLAGALAAPAHALALGRQAGAARFHRDAVGDDEARVEAHAELADQVGVLLLVALERAMNSRVPLLAMVPRCEAASSALMPMPLSRIVMVLAAASNSHADLEVGRVLVQRGVVQRLEAQLVAGVRGVRDQLAQEDLLVRVQRVGDEVQDLLDLGLEGMGLLGHGWSGLFWIKVVRPSGARASLGGVAAHFKRGIIAP
jgi:hypothetical protein